ncbi:hypothetical protein [Streptomyces olivaceoviridis]|uniref:hypothetical protein n=1 Tax=Streptomyces olivaceoviridis TaxID=1921 RepID=UPI003791BF20
MVTVVNRLPAHRCSMAVVGVLAAWAVAGAVGSGPRAVPVLLLASAGAIAERSITGTFRRKFNRLSGPIYVQRLGVDRCAADDRAEVVEALRQVVVRLHRLRGRVLPQPHRRVLAYGDLKLENVLFPDGPDQPPVFIDPGLLLARTAVGVAKLISRTMLTLAASRPGPQTGKHVVHGIGVFTAGRMKGLSVQDRRDWLRDVLVLWLKDSVSILTTHLSAPTELPLPAEGTALVDRGVDAVMTIIMRRYGFTWTAPDGTPRADAWATGIERVDVTPGQLPTSPRRTPRRCTDRAGHAQRGRAGCARSRRSSKRRSPRRPRRQPRGTSAAHGRSRGKGPGTAETLPSVGSARVSPGSVPLTTSLAWAER